MLGTHQLRAEGQQAVSRGEHEQWHARVRRQAAAHEVAAGPQQRGHLKVGRGAQQALQVQGANLKGIGEEPRQECMLWQLPAAFNQGDLDLWSPWYLPQIPQQIPQLQSLPFGPSAAAPSGCAAPHVPKILLTSHLGSQLIHRLQCGAQVHARKLHEGDGRAGALQHG